MEEVQVQSATPAPADATVLPDAAASQPANGDSEGPPPSQEEQNAYVNQVFRQVGRAITTSKPSAAESSGESAPQGDVKPDESQPERDPLGRFIPRRGVPEAVRLAEQEAETAKAKLAELDPVKLREQAIADYKAEQEQASKAAEQEEIARAQAAYDESYLGNEQAYQDALHMADTDPRLGGPAPDGEGNLYTWREERKERRANHGHVEKHYSKVASDTLTSERSAFLDTMRGQLRAVSSLPGVDAERVFKTADFGQIGQQLYEAGKAQGEAPLRAEIARLTNELRQYTITGNRGLGAQREVIPAGRSGGGSIPLNENAYMNNLFRGGQRAG